MSTFQQYIYTCTIFHFSSHTRHIYSSLANGKQHQQTRNNIIKFTDKGTEEEKDEPLSRSGSGTIAPEERLSFMTIEHFLKYWTTAANTDIDTWNCSHFYISVFLFVSV